jgi:hypothetical protein
MSFVRLQRDAGHGGDEPMLEGPLVVGRLRSRPYLPVGESLRGPDDADLDARILLPDSE